MGLQCVWSNICVQHLDICITDIPYTSVHEMIEKMNDLPSLRFFLQNRPANDLRSWVFTFTFTAHVTSSGACRCLQRVAVAAEQSGGDRKWCVVERLNTLFSPRPAVQRGPQPSTVVGQTDRRAFPFIAIHKLRYAPARTHTARFLHGVYTDTDRSCRRIYPKYSFLLRYCANNQERNNNGEIINSASCLAFMKNTCGSVKVCTRSGCSGNDMDRSD